MFSRKTAGLEFKIARSMAIMLISLGLSPDAWADNSQLDSLCSTAAMASDYSGNSTQAQQYCAAGQAAEKAASADSDLWIIYAAAGTVCTSACVASMITPPVGYATGLEMACTGSSLGASLVDAVKTQDYMTALVGVVSAAGLPAYEALTGGTAAAFGPGATTIGGAASALTGGGGAVASAGAGASGTAGATGHSLSPSQGNLASCVAAASNAYQAFSKHSDEDSADATVKQSIQELQALESGSATTSLSSNTTAPAAGINAQAAATTGATSGTTGSPAIGNTEATADASQPSTTCSSGGGAGAAECAATAGNVPIMSPQLANALQAVTGMTPSQYAAQAAQNGPAKALASGLGDGSNAFAGQLQAWGGSIGDAGYYVAGRGATGGGGDPMDKMMGNLLQQFGQKKKADDKPAGVTDLTFGKRSLASTLNPENDRNLSLFTRIDSRYASLTPSLLGEAIDMRALPPLPFATPNK